LYRPICCFATLTWVARANCKDSLVAGIEQSLGLVVRRCVILQYTGEHQLLACLDNLVLLGNGSYPRLQHDEQALCCLHTSYVVG
jgi:hypothetical protein